MSSASTPSNTNAPANTPTSISSDSSPPEQCTPPKRKRGRPASSNTIAARGKRTRTGNERQLRTPETVKFRISCDKSRLECILVLLLKLGKNRKMLSDLIDCVCPKKRVRFPYPDKDKPEVGQVVPGWWPRGAIPWYKAHHLKKTAAIRLALYLFRMHWIAADFDFYNGDDRRERPTSGCWRKWIKETIIIEKDGAVHDATSNGREKELQAVRDLRQILLLENRYITTGRGGDTVFKYERHVHGHMQRYVSSDTELLLAPWTRQPSRDGRLAAGADAHLGQVTEYPSPQSSPFTTSSTDFDTPASQDYQAGMSDVMDSTSPLTSDDIGPESSSSMVWQLDHADYDYQASSSTSSVPSTTRSNGMEYYDASSNHGIPTAQLMDSWFIDTIPFHGLYPASRPDTPNDFTSYDVPRSQ